MNLRPLIPLFLTVIPLSPFASGQEAPMEQLPPSPPGAGAEPAESARFDSEAKPAAPKKEKKPVELTISSSNPGAATVRLFILSGQSNMQGLNPTKSFTPTLVAAFPDDDVVVVKDAQSGEPIRRWLKDWQPAEGVEPDKKAKGVGDLYARLKKRVATALEGKPEPASVVFVWMQGEADARAKWSADNYDKSLLDLIALLRTDMKAPKMPAVIGRLSDYSDPAKLPEWDTIKAKQLEVGKADPLVAIVETEDLNGPSNGLHYNGPGYTELGQRFADAAIKLLKEEK